MKKQLLIVAFIGFCCGSINFGSSPVPQFSAVEARMMQVGGGSLVLPKNPVPGVQQTSWSWNGSQYVGVPVGASATPTGGRNAGGGNNMPNFNAGQIRAMKDGGNVNVNGVSWTWNGTSYVSAGGPAPAPAGGVEIDETLQEQLLAAMSLCCYGMGLCCHGIVAERAIDDIEDATVQQQRRAMVNANFAGALTSVRQALNLLDASVQGND